MISAVLDFLLFFLITIPIIWGVGYGTLIKISRLSTLERFVCAGTIGIVLFTLMLFITAYLHIRFIIIPLFFVIGCYFFISHSKKIFAGQAFFFDKKLAMLICIGVFSQSSILLINGAFLNGALGFFGANAHDGLWHVSLIHELAKDFPPTLPTFAGEHLKNYHFLSDLFLSEFTRFFHINPLSLYFKISPVYYSLLLGLALFILTKKISHSNQAAYWAVFLGYFAGSLGYLLPILGLGGGSWESAFWSIQSISILINPPLAVSFIILLVGLFLLYLLKEEKNKSLLVLVATLFGSLIGFKAYAGLLGLCGLGVFFFTLFLKEKRKDGLLVLPLALLITFLLFLPTNSGAAGFLFFEPGWFLQTMMVTSDRVNFVDWELQRQTFASHNNIPRLVILWAAAFLLFTMGNFGIRAISILNILTLKKKDLWNPLALSITFMIFLGIIIPTLFIQKGVVWNSIQFLYYALLLTNIYSAVVIARLLQKRKVWIKYLVAAVIILLTVPTTINTLSSYFPPSHNFIVNKNEVAALHFLQVQPDGIVLAPYHDIAYKSALSGKRIYFEDKVQSDLIGIDSSTRMKRLEDICKGDFNILKESVKNDDIRYLYLPKDSSCLLSTSNEYLDVIYSNETVDILEFRDE